MSVLTASQRNRLKAAMFGKADVTEDRAAGHAVGGRADRAEDAGAVKVRRGRKRKVRGGRHS